MVDDDDEQDPNAGSTHLKNFMSEAQPSKEAGAFGDKSRNRNPKYSDGYYEQRYGKSIQLDDGPGAKPNRKAKGNFAID